MSASTLTVLASSFKSATIPVIKQEFYCLLVLGQTVSWPDLDINVNDDLQVHGSSYVVLSYALPSLSIVRKGLPDAKRVLDTVIQQVVHFAKPRRYIRLMHTSTSL